jgi:hypothetical protein
MSWSRLLDDLDDLAVAVHQNGLITNDSIAVLRHAHIGRQGLDLTVSGKATPRRTVKPEGTATDFGFEVVMYCFTFVRTSGWIVTEPVVVAVPVVTAAPPEEPVVTVVEV